MAKVERPLFVARCWTYPKDGLPAIEDVPAPCKTVEISLDNRVLGQEGFKKIVAWREMFPLPVHWSKIHPYDLEPLWYWTMHTYRRDMVVATLGVTAELWHIDSGGYQAQQNAWLRSLTRLCNQTWYIPFNRLIVPPGIPVLDDTKVAETIPAAWYFCRMLASLGVTMLAKNWGGRADEPTDEKWERYKSWAWTSKSLPFPSRVKEFEYAVVAAAPPDQRALEPGDAKTQLNEGRFRTMCENAKTIGAVCCSLYRWQIRPHVVRIVEEVWPDG